ncbi:MAG: 3-oxoacyl-[acyl-carrier-protein] reductase [Planctomycetes bacterium]|nr:3-oxoacyl-[acyl-carrier-protein] reductase [Planctomycetota bacterium]MCB9871402.1 3-oxoacyl-[acyl-carrier-protein] reductase [Planctomycetota bacterium]MCB9888653.1 3-oxoacyl-[acyl-carrier-protein] reductase [Planctomycetota bacterium]
MAEPRNALVTGASRGIGRAIAATLAADGFRVLCVSTREGGCDDTLQECHRAGGEARAFVCDVGDEASVAQLAETVEREFGALAAVVNNAGVTRDGLVLRMSTDDFDSVLATNLRGSFLVTRAFARGMTKARAGRIVNVGSVVGVVGNAGQANYAASKAGLIGMTKAMAKEFGGRGVTVNLVAPGFITTDMTAKLSGEIQKGILQTIPLGHFGEPKDVAAAVRFLCSDAASYITGQVLMVDGGMAM